MESIFLGARAAREWLISGDPPLWPEIAEVVKREADAYFIFDN